MVEKAVLCLSLTVELSDKAKMIDFARQREVSFNDFILEHNWVWKGDWKAKIDDSTDDLGWTYSGDGGKTFKRFPDFLSRLRRRVWERHCYKLFA